MKEALKVIFDSIKDSVKANLDADTKGILTVPSSPIDINETGESSFAFHLDSNGHCKAEQVGYGAGKKANCVVWFESPEAIYSISVVSSAGTNFHKDNIKTNERIEFELKTSFWGNTKVTIDGNANVVNQDGRGKIKYSY